MSDAACKQLHPVPLSLRAGCSCCHYKDLLIASPKQQFAEVFVLVTDNPLCRVAPISPHL